MTEQVGSYNLLLTDITLLCCSSPFICTSSSIRKRDVITKPTQINLTDFLNQPSICNTGHCLVSWR